MTATKNTDQITLWSKIFTPHFAGMTGPETGGMFGKKRPIINKLLNAILQSQKPQC
jgi:hypothetical protein